MLFNLSWDAFASGAADDAGRALGEDGEGMHEELTHEGHSKANSKANSRANSRQISGQICAKFQNF